MPRAALLVTLLAVEAQAARPQDLERQVPARQPSPPKEVSVLQANSSDEPAQQHTGGMQEKLKQIRESVVQLQKFRNLEEDALEHFVEQVGSSARDATSPHPLAPDAIEEEKGEKETALKEVKIECLKIGSDERLPCCQAGCTKFGTRFDVTEHVRVTCMTPCMNAIDSMLERHEKDTKKDASDGSDGRRIGQPVTLDSGAAQERAAPNSPSSSSPTSLSSLLETKQVASSSHRRGLPASNYNDLPDASDLEKAIAGVERPLAEATKQASTSLDSAVTWSQVPPLMSRHVQDMDIAVQEAKGYLVQEQERVRGDVQKSPEEVLTHENYVSAMTSEKDQSGDAGRKTARHFGDSA